MKRKNLSETLARLEKPGSPGQLLESMAQIWENHPGSWTTGVPARDRDGKQVPSSSARAVSFCAEGLAKRLEPEWGTFRSALAALEKTHNQDVGVTNDALANQYEAARWARSAAAFLPNGE